jgi:hypothetical protein
VNKYMWKAVCSQILTLNAGSHRLVRELTDQIGEPASAESAVYVPDNILM